MTSFVPIGVSSLSLGVVDRHPRPLGPWRRRFSRGGGLGLVVVDRLVQPMSGRTVQFLQLCGVECGHVVFGQVTRRQSVGCREPLLPPFPVLHALPCVLYAHAVFTFSLSRMYRSQPAYVRSHHSVMPTLPAGCAKSMP